MSSLRKIFYQKNSYFKHCVRGEELRYLVYRRELIFLFKHMKTKLILTICCFAYFLGFIYGLLLNPHILADLNSHYSNNPFEFYHEMNKWEVFVELLKNNSNVIFVNIFTGALSLGILSISYTLYNGLAHGFIFNYYFGTVGYYNTLTHTIPHSFEIIAIIWSCYIGCLISFKLLNEMVLNKKVNYKWKSIILQILYCFIIIVLAAFVESYISIKLL